MSDRMCFGFDEAWIGEHHACGCETIADRLMFISNVALRVESVLAKTPATAE